MTARAYLSQASHTSGTLIDRAKALRGRLLDRVLPQRFVFHHVPKCGGTSVGRALRKRYLLSQATIHPEASFQAFMAFTGRNDTERMLVDVLDLREQMLLYLMFSDIRCISAHVRFSETARACFGERYKFVTVLREPVSRFVSHYNWSHGRPGAHAAIDEGFDAFLGSPRAERMGASYVEYFAGLPKGADLRTQAGVERAIANLRRFDVVGRLDDIDGFRRDLRQALGVRVRIRHENRATQQDGAVRQNALTPAQRRKVEALCAPDIEIWRNAPCAT